MNLVTTCCKANIITKHGTEYPLGGRTWGINTIVDICEQCGEEHPETMEEDEE